MLWMCFHFLSYLEVRPYLIDSLLSKVSGLLWTSNRRIRKAFNRRKSSRRRSYSPFGPTMAGSTFGTNSTPSPKPFIFINSPRSFSASPISSPTSPFIFVNPTPTPSSRPKSPFIHISPRQEATTLEQKSQKRLASTHKRNPYIIVNPRGEAGGRSQEVMRKMLKNPNLNSLPRSIPNSYLPMTSNADQLVTSGLSALPLLCVIYLTS